MQDERNYWMQLFANLLNHCPVDTRNMVTHIEMYESADSYEIMVAAPHVSNPKYMERKHSKPPLVGNYAGAVNYAEKSPHKGWIEKEIDNTTRLVNGQYE